MKLWRKIRRFLPRQIKEALYWLRTHTYNRYHMLDCRSKQNGYTWGWKDMSELILFANMNILKSYVEHEAHYINWKSDDPHDNAGSEMQEIYQWWMKGRKEEHDAYEAQLTKAYGFEECTVLEPIKDSTSMAMRFTRRGDPDWEADCSKCREMDEALEQRDEEMLIRLIKIRGYLWS